MTSVRRLVTYADVDEGSSHPQKVSVTARTELECTDGRRVLLLDDRGWGSTASWGEMSVENIKDNTRMVVGPDESPEGGSKEEMESLYWSSLLQIARQQSIAVDAAELRRLPHDVVLSRRLLARIGAPLRDQ